MKSTALPLLAAVAAALLAGCGAPATLQPRPAAAIQPRPAAVAPAPETSAMGATSSLPGVNRARPACGPQASSQEILQRINAARVSGYRCGRKAYGPAAPLRWNAALQAAAQGHSLDMAKRNYFEHVSPEGATVRTRLRAAHYKSSMVGENIAAGVRTMPEAVQSWLESPGHCENIMNPEFDEVAVACVAQPGTEWGTYWTMVLGRK